MESLLGLGSISGKYKYSVHEDGLVLNSLKTAVSFLDTVSLSPYLSSWVADRYCACNQEYQKSPFCLFIWSATQPFSSCYIGWSPQGHFKGRKRPLIESLRGSKDTGSEHSHVIGSLPQIHPILSTSYLQSETWQQLKIVMQPKQQANLHFLPKLPTKLKVVNGRFHVY